MKFILTNKRNVLAIISTAITVFMIYNIYYQYSLGWDIVEQASLKINEEAERLAIFFKILIACSIISVSSAILSNFVKSISLIVSVLPVVVYFGCSFLISGSITTFSFPWLFFIPVIYILMIIFYEFYKKWKHGSKIHLQIKLDKFLNVYSLTALIACIFVVVQSNEVYQTIILFFEPGTLIFNFIILLSMNYLLLGFTFLIFILNNKIGALLSIFPICLHQLYFYLMNYHFSKFTDLPWEFTISLLLVVLYIWLALQNPRSKAVTIEGTEEERA